MSLKKYLFIFLSTSIILCSCGNNISPSANENPNDLSDNEISTSNKIETPPSKQSNTTNSNEQQSYTTNSDEQHYYSKNDDSYLKKYDTDNDGKVTEDQYLEGLNDYADDLYSSYSEEEDSNNEYSYSKSDDDYLSKYDDDNDGKVTEDQYLNGLNDYVDDLYNSID